MRLPPRSVPKDMAAEQMIILQGKSVALLVSMPASAMPKSPMDMNFCPSWAPRERCAQAQMSCSTMHITLLPLAVDAGEEKLDDLGGGHTRMKPPTSENNMP